MAMKQEPNAVKEYRELFCEMMGNHKECCEVMPRFVQEAPGGLIVAVSAQEHAHGDDPKMFGEKMYTMLHEAGVAVELVMDNNKLDIVAYLDEGFRHKKQNHIKRLDV